MITFAAVFSGTSLRRVFFNVSVSVSVCVVLMSVGCSRHNVRQPVDSANHEIKEIRDPDIHFVPTPYKVVEKMLEMAEVKKSDLVYDLGCGDGRIVITAARKYGCQCIGYDIDPERIIESMANVKKYKVQKRVRIEQQDVFTLDLSKASVITLYLLESLNVKLIPQLERLKPGTRVVSHDFGMRDIVTPDKTVTLTANGQQHTIHLWIAPLKKNNVSN